MAGWTIAFLCIGILIFASAASAESLPRFVSFGNCFDSPNFILPKKILYAQVPALNKNKLLLGLVFS